VDDAVAVEGGDQLVVGADRVDRLGALVEALDDWVLDEAGEGPLRVGDRGELADLRVPGSSRASA
jgi:hypothetical protein